jgi:hypothetical protein
MELLKKGVPAQFRKEAPHAGGAAAAGMLETSVSGLALNAKIRRRKGG